MQPSRPSNGPRVVASSPRRTRERLRNTRFLVSGREGVSVAEQQHCDGRYATRARLSPRPGTGKKEPPGGDLPGGSFRRRDTAAGGLEPRPRSRHPTRRLRGSVVTTRHLARVPLASRAVGSLSAFGILSACGARRAGVPAMKVGDARPRLRTPDLAECRFASLEAGPAVVAHTASHVSRPRGQTACRVHRVTNARRHRTPCCGQGTCRGHRSGPSQERRRLGRPRPIHAPANEGTARFRDAAASGSGAAACS
jgi:hypothetical protein